MPWATRRLPRISARHLLDFVVGLSPIRYEIDLARIELSFTTSLRPASGRARRRGLRSRGNEECFGSTPVRPKRLRHKTDDGAAHSRFVGQELDLICNHNFV